MMQIMYNFLVIIHAVAFYLNTIFNTLVINAHCGKKCYKKQVICNPTAPRQPWQIVYILSDILLLIFY